jgi:hypothetical protein
MINEDPTYKRLAALVSLVEAAPGQCLGRTAIVKLPYFLQELHGVSLGYDFRLHTYGPFDSDILHDLATAKSLDALQETTQLYQHGYGFQIRPGPNAQALKDQAGYWVKKHEAVLGDVARQFGGLPASELELGATVLFVDREFKSSGCRAGANAITMKVCEVKPHFSEVTVRAKVDDFKSRGWLTSAR